MITTQQTFFAAIIIPIRIKRIHESSFQRLIQLLTVIPNDYEIIIVDDGSPNRVHRAISARVHTHNMIYDHIKLVRLETRWKTFSLARSRNIGVQTATAPVVIFHDVDFICPSLIYHEILRHIQFINLSQNPERCFCLPVAFLTEQGNQHFLSNLHTDDLSIWHELRYNKAIPDHAKFIVEGSSAIVVNRAQCLSMGGFDEAYKGHGAEDFEFLHRLSCLYPIAERPIDYEINTGSGAIIAYRGFRAYFALYGKEARSLGLTLVHLYHPKRKDWFYYRHKKNFGMLYQIMLKDNKMSKTLALHVGVHKTATTYIQSRLKHSIPLLKNHGIGYVPLEEMRPAITQKLHKTDELSDHEIVNFLSQYENFQHVIISDENIIGGVQKPQNNKIYSDVSDKIRKILKYTAPNRKVEVHLSIRNYADYFSSRYAESLRHFKYLDFDSYMNEMDLSSVTWVELVQSILDGGASHIHISCFENIFKAEDVYFERLTKTTVKLEDASSSKTTQRSKFSQEGYDVIKLFAHNFAPKNVKEIVRLIDQSNQTSNITKFMPFSAEQKILLDKRYVADIKTIEHLFKGRVTVY